MMRWLIGAGLRFRLVVVGLAAAVIALGVTQLPKAPVDVLPEFTPPYAEIQTEALGLSAQEVEQFITVPLEADLLNGVQGVDVMRARTSVFRPATFIEDAIANLTLALVIGGALLALVVAALLAQWRAVAMCL